METLQKCITDIKQILLEARQKAYQATAFAMIEGFWLIGERIVKEEQQGNIRANYGEQIIAQLSKELGKGFSKRTLWDYKKFYLTFPNIKDSAHVCAQLTWSHIRLIMRVENTQARDYYLQETAEQHWSVRTLERNINTLYYQRLLASQKKDIVVEEMQQKTAEFQQDPYEFIKNPAVLEFLNIPTHYAYNENDLEKTLINNLQQFLLELGKGFAFVARQKHIRTETQDFYIDLVFYNYILKCFVIIELKTDKITRMFDDLEKSETDNPTIGILLCTQTDQTIAKYSVLAENKHLFATKYMPYLPTEEELAEEIEHQKQILTQITH